MTPEEFQVEFHHSLRITVAWGDMDALGHVNNAKYFSFMESARIEFFHGLDNLMPIPRSGVGPILASVDCQFLAPVVYPDDVIVGSRLTAIGNTSFSMEQAIYSVQLGRITTQSKSITVLVNYSTGETVRVPDSIREWLSKNI